MGQDRTEHIDRVGCGRLALLECYYGKGAHAHRQPFTGAWFVAPPTVGPTRARRSYARKRPRLRPIYETVIAQVLGTEQLWEPLRVAERDPALQRRLERLREQWQLPSQVRLARGRPVSLPWMASKPSFGRPG